MLRLLALASALLLSAGIAAAEPFRLSVADAALATKPGQFRVSLTLSPESAKVLGDFTTANVGRKVDVLVDGKVVLSPVLRDPILGGAIEITGDADGSEWPALIARLKSGDAALAVEVAAGS